MKNLLLILLIGLTIFSLGQNIDYEGAILNHEEQVEKFNKKSFQNIKDLVKSYTSYAQFLYTEGDFLNAELQIKKALYSYNKYQLNYPLLESYIYQIIGYSALGQTKYKIAIINYQKALALLPDSSILLKASVNKNIGYSCLKINNLILAEQHYNEAITILSNTDYFVELTKVHQEFGLMLFEMGEVDKAENYLNKVYSITIDSYGPEDNRSISISNYLGYFYITNNQLKKGLSFFQKSIIGVQKEIIDTSIYSNPNLTDLELNIELLYALKYKARAFYLQYKETKNKKDILASIESYQLAIALVEKAKQSFLNEESLLAFSKSYKSSIINNAMIACYEAYLLTEDTQYLELSFNFSEKGKASLLSNALMDFKNKSLEGISDSILNQEAMLKNEISVIKSKLDNEEKPQLKESLEIDLFDKMDLLESLKYRIEQDLGHTIFDTLDFEPVSITEIQNQLKNEEVVIEYTLTGYSLYIYTIGATSFKLVKSRIDSSLFSNIKELRQLVKSTDFEKSFKNFKQFNDLSYRLYQQLISPIEVDIQGKHLIIIPEEELLYVPFGILSKQEWEEGSSFQSLNYLIYDYPISYNYSSTLRFKLEQLSSNSKDEILAYAPSYKNDIDGLNSLPYAQKEVSYIETLFDCDLRLDELATESHFKTYAKDYRYIHLSMHASLNDENSLFTNLYFEQDSFEDGRLEINELYRLKLNSDLVVLSGCSTGDGELYKGEGLYSLSRGFIQAGCPNITLTLWNINDESSYQIISKYYQNLANGLPNDIALQRSKIEYLKQANNLNSLPYFWASHLIIGNNNLIIEQSGQNYYIYIIGIVLLMFSVLLFFLWRKKHM